jgi:hypothetical protein
MVIKRRKTKVGPEAELLELALSSSSLDNKSKKAVIFREPQLPTGYPDLVAVYTGRQNVKFNQFRSGLSTWHFRLLHLIYQLGGGYLQDISQSSLYSLSKVEILIDELSQAGMVYFRGRKIFPVAKHKIFTTTRIVAIEAKVNDWSRAIRQAIANRWFSSHSYILLPEKTRMTPILEEAQSFGIGVMVFDGQNTKELCHPAPQSLPTSYGSWLLNEWANMMIHQGMAT